MIGNEWKKRREGDKCRNELEKHRKSVRDENNKGTIFFARD
jgi:hypothetical protein